MKLQKGRQGGKRLAPLLIRSAAALALCLLLLCVPAFPNLAVRDGRTGRLLLLLPMEDGETFSIQNIHSVNLSPVTDTIRCSGDTLILESTLFSAYGWGMPVLADGIGKTFLHTEAGFCIGGIDKAQADIPIMLQQVPNHRLLYRGREISLLALAGSGAFIRITFERNSILERFIHYSLHKYTV